MEKKMRKAQAALEFLTTYGWAFLIILLMIGVLAYFGILSPSKILPNRCNFGAEFQCLDYQISATANTFKLRLKNGIGVPVAVSSISLGSEGATQYICTTPPALPGSWTTGSTVDFTWALCNSAAAGMIGGEKGKVFIVVRFYDLASGAAYTKEVRGEVYSTVV